MSSGFSLRPSSRPPPPPPRYCRENRPRGKSSGLGTCVHTWARGDPPHKSECPPSKARAKAGSNPTPSRVPVNGRCHRSASKPQLPRCLALSKLVRSEPRPAGRLHLPVCRGSPRASGGRAGWSRGDARGPADGTSQAGARPRGGAEAGAGASRPLPFPRQGLGAPRGAARGGDARTRAAAPAPARIPARRRYSVQLGLVTEEQLFAAGPLWLPFPKSLRLEVHPAREEEDATGTAGELLASPKGRPWAGARGVGAEGCGVRSGPGARLPVLSGCAPPPHQGLAWGTAGLSRQFPKGPHASNCVLIEIRETLALWADRLCELVLAVTCRCQK